jgi:arginyl-tRNA synthetase
MADPRDVLAQRVSAALGAAFGPEYEAADPVIRPSSFADYQSNAALPLAKKLGRPPRDIAADIIRHLDLDGVAEPPEVSGPGFINLRLLPGWIAAEATSELLHPRLGVEPADQAELVVVDYSGPNVAKELHVGHLRATVVGDALARILEHLGHTVVRAAHLGDWGTPFGMLIEHALDIGGDAASSSRRVSSPRFTRRPARSSTVNRASPTGRAAGLPCSRAASRRAGGCGRSWSARRWNT